jgi:RHS repeat-associated protein
MPNIKLFPYLRFMFPNPKNTAIVLNPFGSIKASVSKGEYRYGFNGKETDNETGLQDYGFRIYNPSYGRFLSVDPLSRDYPWNSTYAFAENDVIRCVDLDGLERFIVSEKPYIDEKGEPILKDGKPIIELTFVLDSKLSVQEQAATGMMLFSYDGGQTFSNNYKYAQIANDNPHFLNMRFDTKSGDLYTTMPNGEKYILNGTHAGTISGGVNASNMKTEFEDGHIAPPHYSVRLSITDKTQLTLKSNTYSAEFEGYTWGVATSAEKSLTYVSGAGVVSAKFKYNMGHTDYPNQKWDILITDNSGNTIWSQQNANTAGQDVEVDITNQISQLGVHNLNISVVPSSSSQTPPSNSRANVSTDFNFKLEVSAQSYE